MEDLNLDDEPLPKLSREGVGSLRSILIARESGTLGRLPPRCISSKFSACKSISQQALNYSNTDIKPDDVPENTPKSKKPCMVGLERLAQEAAEERLAGRELKVSECELRGRQTRSAFLVVFSPDRELMASTHGDHNIYVSQVSSGKCISTLKGHPRTPWCIAFHPTRKWLLASGCLGGHVRLWDLMGDGSEVWRADGVVASLAFHPTDRLLVIATFNELHFWDWSRNLPFAKVTTASEKEKVRYVKFDALGHQLITGIANLSGRDIHNTNSNANSTPSQQHSPNYLRRSFEQNYRSDYTFIPPRLRGSTNAENDSAYGLTAYGRYRSYMSGINPSHHPIRRERERSEIRNQFSDPAVRRTVEPNDTVNSTTSSFRDAEVSSTRERDSNRNLGENGDRNSSASQTLSDLAAAASNRLMAENAAENAASHQTTRSLVTSDSQMPPFSYSDRRNLIGALRSSSDPFFGVSSSSTNQPESSLNEVTASTSQWASNDEMEAIRQSQIQQLRTFRSYQGPRSPPLLPSDIDNLLRQEESSRLREYNTSFSHSPESSFIEVNNSLGNGRSSAVPQYNGTNRTQVYARSTARARAQERYREISERRLRRSVESRRRMISRRQALVSQIEELRNARDYLIDIDRRSTTSLESHRTEPEASMSSLDQHGSEAHNTLSAPTRNPPNVIPEFTNTGNDTSTNNEAQSRDSRAETRVIDDWARARRRRLESYRRRNLQPDSYQIRRSYNHYGALNAALNRRNSSNRDINTFNETNRTQEQVNESETSNPITQSPDDRNNMEYSPRIIEPEVVALPESSRLQTVNSNSNANLHVLSNENLHESSINSSNSPAENLVGQNNLIRVSDSFLERSSIADANAMTDRASDNNETGNTNRTLTMSDSINPVASLTSSSVLAEWGSMNTNDIRSDQDENTHNDHTYSNLETGELGSLEGEISGANDTARNLNNVNSRTDDISLNIDQVSNNGMQTNGHDLTNESRNVSDNTTAGGSNESNSAASRSNLDIILLSRHIDHMQRICRASLADCVLNRHRRQVVRLQSIRRMLEDLQRQIRCLRAASNEELSRRSREAENLGSVLGNVRQSNRGENYSQSGSSDLAVERESLSPNYNPNEESNNHDRDNEEEGHFDLIDEDAHSDELMTMGQNLDSSTVSMREMNASEALPTSYRSSNQAQPGSRLNNSSYQLRTRACNRINRNTSSRLRRNLGQTAALTTPRIYRYPGRFHHLSNNSSTGSNPTIARPLRTMPRSTEISRSNFDSTTGGRRYYRGSHLRINRRSNSNAVNSLSSPEGQRISAPTRRSRLSRSHNQLFSQLRDSVRAIETNSESIESESTKSNEATTSDTYTNMGQKGLTLSDPSKHKLKKATEGKNVEKLLQIKNSSNKHLSGSCRAKSRKNVTTNAMLCRSTKEELRALSQRLEKLIKDKRESQSAATLSSLYVSTTPSSPITSEQHNEQNNQVINPLSEGEQYLLSLPRPDPRMTSPNGSSLSDPRLRWRHLMEGIDEHILNDPMPPRRSIRYGIQRHNSSHHRDQDLYPRQNYRSQRRDSSPLAGRNRTSRATQPSLSLLDGTLPSIEGTDSGSDTDDANLNANESREFPHNSSLEWNGGTSSSPLFRHGFGRWPVRRLSRREELMDISAFGRNLNRQQGDYSNLLSPNRNNDNEELEERWREDRRRIRNRASARLSRMRLLDRTNSNEYISENSAGNNVNEDIDQYTAYPHNRSIHRAFLARGRSPVTTNPPLGISSENNAISSENQELGVNINSGVPDTLDIDRLPPLRELIWRRLRRRNAQLNMLENEIAATSNHESSSGNRSGLDQNQETNERSSNSNSSGRDINRPHREFLTWMVDQMRLDHGSNYSQGAVRRVDEHNHQNEAQMSNSQNDSENEQVAMDPSTRHISFSREFITPPPIQYRHRHLNIHDNSELPNMTSNETQPSDGGGTDALEQRPRPSTYAAAAVNGLIARNNLSGSSVSNNAQTNATAATFQREHYYLHNAPANMLLTHRIQSWDFHKEYIPDLRDSNKNLVVSEARIHNDASVDVSEDGSILVTLIPSNMPMTTVVGVYGLKPDYNRGRCYAHFSLESSAVSVSLSPTSRYLLVGLAIRTGRLILSPTERTLMGQIFRIQLPHERNSERGRLIHRKDLHQTEPGQTSLNCIRWIPVAGQGIVYATNTGLLKILR